jgi:Transcriptional regulator
MSNTVLSAQHSKSVEPNVERSETPNGSPRRQSILDASARLFSDQGFSGTTIRQIAEHANIESGSLYYHFRSKNEILQEILVFAISTTDRRIRATVAELPEETSPRQKIEAALWAHLQALHDHIEYTSTNGRYSGQIPAAVHIRVQPHRQKYSDFWQDLLRQAQEDGAINEDLNLSLLRPLILGTLNHTMDWYDAKRGNIDELFGIIKVMISGIWNVAD